MIFSVSMDGFIATGVIITIVITMMTPIGTAIETQLVKFVNDFASEVGTLIGGISN